LPYETGNEGPNRLRRSVKGRNTLRHLLTARGGILQRDSMREFVDNHLSVKLYYRVSSWKIELKKPERKRRDMPPDSWTVDKLIPRP
jgi:hypothetical protein